MLTEDRETSIGEVNAELMGAAGLRHRLVQRHTLAQVRVLVYEACAGLPRLCLHS